MEPSPRKTTILLSPAMHRRLVSLARTRKVSMGHLIRKAVEAQYGLVEVEERLEALRVLEDLALPVDTPAAMKAESVPFDDEPAA